jgi:alkylated DNA repair dioxygenase AlkB
VVAAMSLGSPSTMRFRPKRHTHFFLPMRQESGRAGYKEVLEVPMKHGDIMVMVGTQIQKVYEVSHLIRDTDMDVADKSSTPSTPMACDVSLSPLGTLIRSGWPRRQTGTMPL